MPVVAHSHLDPDDGVVVVVVVVSVHADRCLSGDCVRETMFNEMSPLIAE